MAIVQHPGPLPQRITSRSHQVTLGLCLAFVFVFSLLRFDGPSRGYWDTYITVPAMFMTGQRVELTRTDGTPRFDYELKGRIPDDTFDPSENGFGISSKDQRIGAGILFSAPFALFNMAAFRWGYATCWTLLFLFTFLGIRRVVARKRSLARISHRSPTAVAIFTRSSGGCDPCPPRRTDRYDCVGQMPQPPESRANLAILATAPGETSGLAQLASGNGGLDGGNERSVAERGHPVGGGGGD